MFVGDGYGHYLDGGGGFMVCEYITTPQIVHITECQL